MGLLTHKSTAITKSLVIVGSGVETASQNSRETPSDGTIGSILYSLRWV